jgi:phytoene dehydrogenase-like protein
MKGQRDEFDVIVLGSALGGLIAATLLSRQNHKVLCLKESGYHPSYSREGYRFVPFSNFSEKRFKLSLWKALSQGLNLSSLIYDHRLVGKDEARLDRSRPAASFQVILPRARVDLFSRGPMFLMEWKREFPKEVAQIENLYNELDRIQHLLKRRKAKEGSWSVLPLRPSSPMKRWFSFNFLPKERIDERLSPFSREFRKFIQLQLISWCNLYSENLPIPLASYLLLDGEGEEGVSNIECEKVERYILGRFIQSGGRVEEIEGVEKVDIGLWKKRFTLTPKEGERRLRSKFLIVNSPLHHVSPFFGRREKLFSKWREKVRPRYTLLPLFLGIDEKAVPVGMRDLLVSILDLEKPYEGGNVLFLSLSHGGDQTAAPEGKRALTVESLIPVGQEEKNSLDEHLIGVMRHVHHLFPFLEDYIEFRDWSWADGQSSQWSYPHFVYETPFDFNWQEGIVPLRMRKNLYFIGKENFPYLGLEGEILGGWRVGKEILGKYE